MRKLTWVIAIAALVWGLPLHQIRASGYLTPMQSGVTVRNYMVNNNAGSGGGTGFTIWVSGISNPDGCTGTDKVHIKSTTAGYREMMAVVLSAVASDRKIGFYSSGCEIIPFWGGTITYPVVTDVWVSD